MCSPGEIGGDFQIRPTTLLSFPESAVPHGLLLASGRDCLHYLIEALGLKREDTVLLPAYLCESILKPFHEQQIRVTFFKIRADLGVDVADVEKKAEAGVKAVLVIHYFGFIQSEIQRLRQICARKNVVLIEDLVQASLTDYVPLGDCFFTSFRKLLPLPDGGIVWSRRVTTNVAIKTDFAHGLYVCVRFLAGLLKNVKWMKRIWRPMFVWAEYTLLDSYEKPSRMSALSKFLLIREDLSAVVMWRKTNYEFLLREINDNPEIRVLFRDLPPAVCPLGFPILVKNRDALRRHLIHNRIYTPVHWELPEEVQTEEFETSCRISNTILTIPIDQRYNEDDLSRVVQCIKSFLAGNA
jgi:dTDP-4-amino-4,6-dideoxygalactose transaminase